ncbi:MAG: MBL fold metallo-hydrolase [Bacteroidota bacterium]
MNIIWKGQSCFQISANQGKGNNVNVVIDPFDETIGLRAPKLEADLLLVSHGHHDHNNKKGVLGNYFLVEGPGEYEVKDIFVQGIQSFHDTSEGKDRGMNTIYTIEAEDLKICHLGDLGQKELTPEQVEQIGDVDILMIPVGGNFTIEAKEAVKIISQIEPSIIIPMHYFIPKLKIKLEGVDKFLKTMGIKKLDPIAKLSIKKKDISPEEAKIVVLSP